jgi:hypothetical protein
MRWADIAGPPGSGKSTIAYPVWGDRSVGWDGKPPPAYWRPFLDEITNLCGLVSDHPSLAAVLRMNERSIKKMATVERMPVTPPRSWMLELAPWCFVQTGLVQRILGFGWRLQDMGRDINLIRTALWRMPVSVGVVFLEASLECILARNRAREQVAATAHENRSYQVPLMLPSITIAKEVMHERGVPVLEVDVEHQSIDAARAQLLAFADRPACHAAAS